MNAKDVKKFLNDNELWEEFREFVWNEGWYASENYKENPFVIDGDKFEAVSSYRSDYGDHDSQFFVFKIGEKFFEISGYYSSWDGSNYDFEDFYEVKPVEVKKIEYRKVKKV